MKDDNDDERIGIVCAASSRSIAHTRRVPQRDDERHCIYRPIFSLFVRVQAAAVLPLFFFFLFLFECLFG